MFFFYIRWASKHVQLCSRNIWMESHILHVDRCTFFHWFKERTHYDENSVLNSLWNNLKGTADMTTPHCSGIDTIINYTTLQCTKVQAEQDCCLGLPLRCWSHTIRLVELGVCCYRQENCCWLCLLYYRLDNTWQCTKPCYAITTLWSKRYDTPGGNTPQFWASGAVLQGRTTVHFWASGAVLQTGQQCTCELAVRYWKQDTTVLLS
jgi:hypothetical protein